MFIFLFTLKKCIIILQESVYSNVYIKYSKIVNKYTQYIHKKEEVKALKKHQQLLNGYVLHLICIIEYSKIFYNGVVVSE